MFWELFFIIWTDSFSSSTNDTRDKRTVTAGTANPTGETGYNATTTSNVNSGASRTVAITKGSGEIGTGGGTYYADSTGQYGGNKTITCSSCDCTDNDNGNTEICLKGCNCENNDTVYISCTEYTEDLD